MTLLPYRRLSGSRYNRVRFLPLTLLALAVTSVAQTPPPTLPAPPPSGGARIYKGLIPPKLMESMFGHQLAKEYLGIQVTVVNMSSDYDLLIRDISVIDPGTEGCGTRTSHATAPARNTAKLVATPEEVRKIVSDEISKSLTARGIRGPEQARLLAATVEQDRAESRDKCAASSHELSNLRGAAERGMSQDPRNIGLRGLRAVGIVGGGLVAVAGLGPILPLAVSAFSNSLIPAYEKLFPDYTKAR